MVIMELFNTGLVYMFLCFSEPLIWIPACSFLFLGLMIQFALLKKSQKKLWRMSVFAFDFIGIVICECAWHLQTEWGKFIVTMVCLLLISMLFGAGITVAASYLINNKCVK